MIIAVDFDGTIVEHKYPAIGKEIPFAFETLRKLQIEHHKLILWSVREGKLLDEAAGMAGQDAVCGPFLYGLLRTEPLCRHPAVCI